MKIDYYFCTAKVERNKQYPIHVLIDYDRAWEENVLRQRCLLGNRFYEREATAEEIEKEAQRKRAQSFRYKTFAALLEDEQRCYPSTNFLEGLQRAWVALKLGIAE